MSLANWYGASHSAAWSCSAKGGAALPTNDVVDQADAQLATYESGAPSFMAALDGTLAVHRGGVVVGDPGRHTLVVFHATEVEWTGTELRYRQARYTVGDQIDLMGGSFDLAKLAGVRLPAEWTDTARAFVVAPADE